MKMLAKQWSGMYLAEWAIKKAEYVPMISYKRKKTMKSILDQDYHEDFYNDIVELSGNSEYVQTHMARYMHTLAHLPRRHQFDTRHVRVLEIGTSLIFPQILLNRFGFEDVEVTRFGEGLPKGEFTQALPGDPQGRTLNAFNVNVEFEPIPRPDEYYDLILCFEVIEHMEVDPMALLYEVNRLSKKGGLVYLTTPNSTSARIVRKILHGHAPHFFMQFSKAREYYRHNIEYSPEQLLAMMDAAGFSTRKFWTADNFEEGLPEVIKFLEESGYPTENRGDNMLYIGQKLGVPRNRYPELVYF